MKFIYSNNKKPKWIDSSIKWRGDLWEIYTNDCIVNGRKNWITNVAYILNMIKKTLKENKLELIIVFYAICIDNKIICKLHEKFWKLLNERIIKLDKQLKYKYNIMFKKIDKVLNKTDSKTCYNCKEEYYYINNKFDLLLSYSV